MYMGAIPAGLSVRGQLQAQIEFRVDPSDAPEQTDSNHNGGGERSHNAQ